MGEGFKARSYAAMALMAAIAFPTASQAYTWHVVFSGPQVSGALAIDFKDNTNTGPLSSSPNQYDPVGSYVVTNVSGTISDAKVGFTNEAVTALVAVHPTDPESSNLLAPASFSLFKVTNGVSDGGVPSPGFHYDNLLYPNGSPQTASDYPVSGGIFDIYGLMFTLGNGDSVNLWSNGNFGGGASYGVAVTDGIDSLHYTGGVSLSVVPLPGAAPLFGAALLALAGFGYGMNQRLALKAGRTAASA